MKSRYYDLQHIKEIPIGDYLHACGIKPTKRYNGYALYRAPYRDTPNADLKGVVSLSAKRCLRVCKGCSEGVFYAVQRSESVPSVGRIFSVCMTEEGN